MSNYIICYQKNNLTYKGLWIGESIPLILDKNLCFIRNLEINNRSLNKEIGLKTDVMFQEIVCNLIETKIKNKYEQLKIYNLNNNKDIHNYKTFLNVEKRKGLSKNFRGDFSLIHDNYIYVYDVKNYTYINPNRMKPSELIKTDIDSYSKTVDTNLIGVFMQPEIKELIDFTAEDFSNHNEYKKKISVDSFTKFLKLIEFGPASFSKDFNYKCFIKYNERTQQIQTMEIDFEKIKSLETEVVVHKFYENGYYYMQFLKNNGKLIYEVSMRGNKKPNCAFINKEYTKEKINETDDGLGFIDYHLIESILKQSY